MKPESTLGRLLKGWGAAPAAEAVQPEALAALQAEFDAFRATAESDIAEIGAKLTEALDALKTVEAARDELAAKLQSAEAEAAAKAEAEAAAKLQARKTKIEAAVGTERADAVFAAVNGMDDAQFEAVLSAMTVAGASEAKSKMFSEQGADLDADPAAAAAGPSKEMQILRAKYGNAN